MKLRAILILALLLVAILGGCGDKSTPTRNGEATVTITALRQDQPVDSALVTVSPSSGTGGLVAVGTTDEEGKCILSGIGSGNYVISVSKSIEGQLIYGTKSNVQISAGGNISQSVEVDQQADDPFPLALGNTWTFSDGSDSTDTIGIFSTKVVGGVLTYTCGPKSGGHPPYITRGVTSVYWHGYETLTGGDYILDTPVVFLDFGASPGDTWTIPNWGTVELVQKGLDITVPAGSFADCMHFKFTSEAVVTDWWNAPGVGPVQLKDINDIIGELVDYELH